jgi:subtilisin family serine protease
MELTSGRPEVVIALLDGPVAADHPDLATENIREVPGGPHGRCAQPGSLACMHGTFVAGILSAKRGSRAPAICPDCTLLVRPIFGEAPGQQLPSATPEELAAAIIECVDAGARVFSLSAGLAQHPATGEPRLQGALDYAARRGVIAVVAAGNQGTVGGSAIISHPWVIPVAGCDRRGRPINESNLGGSIGRRGLSAPGDEVTSLGTAGRPVTSGGTSVAAPFVTGAVALLWSQFPTATAAEVKLAITRANMPRRATIVPPVLDAWAAYERMVASSGRR